MSRTLGIDLSASPEKTGACEIDWAAGTVRLLPRPTADDALVDAILRADKVGIDVPLGWPDAFVEAVAAHHDASGWPPAAITSPLDREQLRFRATDLASWRTGARPLSVSSDLIGVAAMRGARLQHLLREAGVPIDRSGITGRIAEVYPAAALRTWALTSRGYKGTKNAAVCAQLAKDLGGRCGDLSEAVGECLDGCDDDALDAMVCAIVARAVELGHTTPPPDELLAVARREGWIHIPRADVGLEATLAADRAAGTAGDDEAPVHLRTVGRRLEVQAHDRGLLERMR